MQYVSRLFDVVCHKSRCCFVSSLFVVFCCFLCSAHKTRNLAHCLGRGNIEVGKSITKSEFQNPCIFRKAP